MEITKWNSIDYIYRLNLVKLFYNILNGHAINSISDLLTTRESGYNLRGQYKIVVPRFNSYIMKNSLSNRGAIFWYIVSRYNPSDFNTFYSNVKKDVLVKELNFVNFACTSAQSQPRNMTEFKFN